MPRVLKAIRQSRYRTQDPNTTHKVQDEIIERWIAENRHTPIGDATDLDVSAYKVGPFARPQLGDWLTFRKSEFDIVVWARLDRAIRNMADMSDLVRWAKENRKTLVFVNGPGGSTMTLDMASDAMAEFIALIFAFAAQSEAQADSERVTETRAFLRAVGRYAGGWTPFGYSPVKSGKSGWRLRPDKYAPILERIVADFLAGMGLTTIADWLDAENIPTSKDIVRIRAGKEPKGLRWRYPAVIEILRSRAMCGITEVGSEPVYGDDSMPLRFHKGIITEADWRKVQERLDDISRTITEPRKDSPWLTGITFCKACGGPLYSKRQKNHGKTYEYMRCDNRDCQARQIRNEYLTAEINAWIVDVCDGRPYWATRTIEGRNHAAEIATVIASIQDIGGKATVAEALGKSVTTERKQLAQLKARLAMLQKMPDEPDRIVPVQTGLTIAQHWANLNETGRHAMLKSHGVKVQAEQTGYGPKTLVVTFDPGTLLRDWTPTVYDKHVVVTELPELAQPLPVQE
jgi:DNA invertase Pin-like site-specific DNA recombinase